MPELPELKISSDFINQYSKKTFNKIFSVGKGNMPNLISYCDEFCINSRSNGKELVISLINDSIEDQLDIWVFMGMSGNWKYVPTHIWSETKFTRLRLDDVSGNSLLLYGGYMGPKISIGRPFLGTKRGPDPTRDFEKFRSNILDNLSKKTFNGLICEVLLNQEYFNGIGNYLRSTILYYADVNPFEPARKIISENESILDLCRDIPLESYRLNGGQLKDWKSPFGGNSDRFKDWVYYQKGLSCKDKSGRTFWFSPKWINHCPYDIKG